MKHPNPEKLPAVALAALIVQKIKNEFIDKAVYYHEEHFFQIKLNNGLTANLYKREDDYRLSIFGIPNHGAIILVKPEYDLEQLWDKLVSADRKKISELIFSEKYRETLNNIYEKLFEDAPITNNQ